MDDVGLADDIAPRMVEAVRPFVAEALIEDIERMRLDRRFAAILCAGVLEFVQSPRRCLENLVGHLEPCGRLLLLFPRRTVAGRLYQLINWRRGIRTRLFDVREVEALAAALGLQQLGAARPFFHNQILVYRR